MYIFILGSRNSTECTLILTEGDSAKTLAVSGLGVVGRDKYGVFPLRGKILNVREASHKQVGYHTSVEIRLGPVECNSVVQHLSGVHNPCLVTSTPKVLWGGWDLIWFIMQDSTLVFRAFTHWTSENIS